MYKNMEEVTLQELKRLLRKSGVYCCIASKKFPELFLSCITKREAISSLADAKAESIQIIQEEKRPSGTQMIAILL